MRLSNFLTDTFPHPKKNAHITPFTSPSPKWNHFVCDQLVRTLTRDLIRNPEWASYVLHGIHQIADLISSGWAEDFSSG